VTDHSPATSDKPGLTPPGGVLDSLTWLISTVNACRRASRHSEVLTVK
jgi:hypothetical protein